MINYYFKYLELLDTVFLALKKKPLGTCQSPYFLANGLLTFHLSFLARFSSFGHRSSVLYST